MSELKVFNAGQTMSSLEIAELTGKKISNIHRDVKKQILKGLYTIDDSNCNHEKIQGLTITLDERGYWSEVLFDRYHADVLITGYEVKYRAAVVKRWHELEAALPKLTLIESLQLYIEELKAKELALAEVAKLNTLLDNEFGYCSILRAAKFLSIHETAFNWRPLKRATVGLGMQIKQVPSPRFGYQNLYPLRAFVEVYPQYDFDDLTPELVDDKAKLALI